MSRKLKAALISSDPYFLHPGDGVKVISDYVPDATHLTFDSGTGVWDGLLAAFKVGPILEDDDVWSNSHDTASFSVHILDYNNDGVLDTMISMGADAFVVLGHTDVLASDVFGG